MEYWCHRLGEAWGKLQWGVPPWVHGLFFVALILLAALAIFMFSAVLLHNRGNNRSKGIEKNSMRVWCLGHPQITPLGIRDVVHTNVLNIGLPLYEARQGRGEAVV